MEDIREEFKDGTVDVRFWTERAEPSKGSVDVSKDAVRLQIRLSVLS